MIEHIPRIAKEEGWGFWCYRCRRDLGSGHPHDEGFSVHIIDIVKRHLRNHLKAMREQL